MKSKTGINRYMLILITLLFLIACSKDDSSKDQKWLVFKNVNLITMESDEVISDQCVIIKENKIDFIGKLENAKYPSDADVIDAQDKYMMPGLCDMHMHIDHPDILKVNLAFGITTVMNYRGLPEHLTLREKSRSNKIFAPNIYTTGDYMEGYPATMPGFLSFDNVDDARKSVQYQKEKGYDFIKVYRNLDSLLHLAICEEARKNNMTVVGHLSPDISLQQSLEAGQKVIAHTEELMYFFDNENDTSKIKDLIELLLKYDISYSPNLTIFRSLPLQVQKLDSLHAQDCIKYLQPAIFQSWRKEYNYNHTRGEEWAQFMWARFDFLQEVTRRIHQAGIQILTSTDAPTSGAFPGVAVHEELKEFIEIGFTPYEALKSATVEPGKFIKKYINEADNFGMIKKGYRADLLLLNKNPLEKVEHTREIFGVVKNGNWYTHQDISNELETLNEVYTAINPMIRSIEKAIENENVIAADSIYLAGKNAYDDQLFLGYYTMWYAGYKFLYENRKITEDPIRANKAIRFYEMYARQYPDMHGSHYILGMAHKANKDTSNAILSFEKSLTLHPGNPYALKQINNLKAVDSSNMFLETKDIRGGRIWSLDWSADGKYIACGNATGLLRIYDAKEYKLVNLLTGFKGTINGIHFSPDGSKIVATGPHSDPRVIIWDLANESRTIITDHERQVRAVQWSPKGIYFATTSHDGTIRIWDDKGTFIKMFTGANFGCVGIDWLDEDVLAASCWDNTIRIYSLAGRDSLLMENGNHRGKAVLSVDWHPDGDILVTGDYGNNSDPAHTVKFWSRDGQLISTDTSHEKEIRGLKWNPQGTILATGGETVRLWDKQGTLLNICEENTSPVWSLDWNELGDKIASGHNDGKIRIWDANGDLLHLMDGHPVKVTALSFNLDSSQIGLGFSDGELSIINVQENTSFSVNAHERSITNIVWSPDENQIAVSSYFNNCSLWNVDNQLKLVKKIELNKEINIIDIAWKDNAEAAILQNDGKVIKYANNQVKDASVIIDIEKYNGIKWVDEKLTGTNKEEKEDEEIMYVYFRKDEKTLELIPLNNNRFGILEDRKKILYGDQNDFIKYRITNPGFTEIMR